MKQFCKPLLFKFGVLISFLFIQVYAFAQLGALDMTFGNGGKVITSISNSDATANSVVAKNNGKIIIGGSSKINGTDHFTLVQYNPDGSLDTTFGNKGIVATSIGFKSTMYSIALQSDGKIVAGGYSTSNSTVSNQIFTLARYYSNGSRDTLFGNVGVVTTIFQSGSSSIKKVIVKPDGKILVGGLLSTMTFEEYPILAQYLPTGILDNSFGTNGTLITGVNVVNGKKKGVSDMALSADGKIIMAIEAYPVAANNSSDFLLVQLLQNGKIDSSFANNGFAQTDFNNSGDLSYSLAVLPDSAIVLAGYSHASGSLTKFALGKYQANGQLNTSFGNGGKVSTSVGTYPAIATHIVVKANGSIVLTGNTYYTSEDFAIIKYNSDGTVDNSFGSNGVVTTDFLGHKDESFSSAIQADGKLVVVGHAMDNSKYNIALARYSIDELSYYNTLKGTAYFDNNKNGTKEADEPLYSNLNIISARVGKDTLLVNSSSGRFTVYNDTGLYVTTAIPYSLFLSAVPSYFTTNHSTYFNTDSISFAVQPLPGKRDIAITVIPLSPARPGFQAMYKMMYTNFGTDTLASGYVGFLKDNRLTYLSASANPLYINGDSIVWSISNLKPMDTGSVIIYCRVQAPPVTNVNDTLHCAGVIYPATGDLVPGNNVSNLSQRVVGSYDPNSKSENHGGSISISDVASGQYLEYTISFQNTGNDSAFNVYIRDTLDAKLDWSTFAMVATSHNYQLVINDQAKCLWSFNGINLPDSNRNEPASHGFITFIIKPKSNLVVGDIITNKAAIYFDYNLPIITNVEKTRVVSGILPLKLLQFSAIRHGKTNLLQWKTVNEQSTDFTLIERSNNGTEFTSIGSVKAGLTSYSFTDYSPPTSRGTTFNYYRLKMFEKDGRFTYSPIRLVNNSSTFEVSLYPNPAKTKLQVNIESDKDATVQYEIISQGGQIQLSSSWTVQEGSNSKSFSVTNLPTGQYFLRISLSNKEQSVLKFEKL